MAPLGVAASAHAPPLMVRQRHTNSTEQSSSRSRAERNAWPADRCAHLAHQAELQRALCVHWRRRQAHVLGGLQADHARQQLCHTATRHDAVHCVRVPKDSRGRGHEDVAVERDLEAARDAGACDRGDDGHVNVLQLPDVVSGAVQLVALHQLLVREEGVLKVHACAAARAVTVLNDRA